MSFLSSVFDTSVRGPIYVCTHVRPDCDAVGAQIAFTRYLCQLQKEAYCYWQEEVPSNLHFLKGDTRCVSRQEIQQAATFVALDCADATRMDLQPASILLNVDHHPNNPCFATYNYAKEDYSSTCEILIELFKEDHWTPDLGSAQALYAGLLTDTGNFSHSNVSARTFDCAKFLLECTAIKPYEIIQQLFAQKQLAQLNLLSLFLSRIQLFCDGQIACVELSSEDYLETHTKHSDTEGFISNLLTLQTVKIAAFVDYNEHFVKGSLRSRTPEFAVNTVAQSLGGGGHVCAAGFQCPIDQFDCGQLIEKLSKLLS